MTENFKLSHIPLGVAYYPEHDPEQEWDTDARLMQDMGIDFVRVGEFAWSRMQKPDGTLTLDWIERLLETLHKRGIRTMLCTPTATPPVWLCDRYPDLPLVTPDGRRGEFGGRRHYSPFHEGYLSDCGNIAAALAHRFGRHEAVLGWQIDNEVGSYSTIDCSEPARKAFHKYLADNFASPAELNRRWGLIFWNQEVERFDQVPTAHHMMCTRSPQHIIAYNRFCRLGWARFILNQARAMRPHLSGSQFLMATCEEAVSIELHAIEKATGEKLLDFNSVNNYPELLPDNGQNAMRLDRHRGINKPNVFLNPELQTGSGYTTTGGINPAPRRLWAFESLARGARLVSWFHWRRFRTGCEWRLTSILERDRKPRLLYRSMQELVKEIRTVSGLLMQSTVKADVQVLYALDSVLARDRSSEPIFWMQIQLPDAPHERHTMWEKEVRRAVYLPLSQLGCTVDFVMHDQPWDVARPLIIPDLDLCDDAIVDRLTEHCRQGGTLICFPGVGERDLDGGHIDAPSPGRLGQLFGVGLSEYYPVQEWGGPTFDPATHKMTQAEGTTDRKTQADIRIGNQTVTVDVRHGEVLEPTDAQTIGTYIGGPFDGQPAVTRRALGKGQAIYLGAVPADSQQALSLYRAILPNMPDSVIGYRVVKLQSEQGAYQVLINDSTSACPLAGPVSDIITGQTFTELPAFGVALVKVG
jgi:beta-galactosidase